jgi:hypothetical protein
MKKLVSENLNEYWESSDTGLENYDIAYSSPQEDQESEETHNDFSNMVPPSTIKLSPEEFDDYVSQLIEFIPQAPVIAAQIFKTTLNMHPYLKRNPIGFKSENPYQPIIQKFIETFKLLTQR